VRDPTQRPSAEQLLKHDWLVDTEEAKVSAGQVIEANINLMNFRKMTVFQQGIVAYIMSFTQRHEEMDRVREVFLELDKSGDGTLSVEEVRDGLVRAMGCVKGNLEDFNRIMADLDKDGNGVVDYSEFIAASINKQTIVDQ
jgi:calcium-dependent protein kinase